MTFNNDQPDPRWQDNPYETRQSSYPPNYQDYQGYQQQPSHNQPQSGGAPEGLIAGRFVTKTLVTNLVFLALLGGVITFAATWVVDLVVNAAVSGVTTAGTSAALGWAFIAAFASIIAGLLFIPVYRTANEGLFRVAISAIAIIAAVVWVVLGGLMNGDWTVLTALAGIISTAAIAAAAPSRVAAADHYAGR